MNPIGTTFKQAFEKQAFLGAVLKGTGKFLGSIPFWLGGASLAEGVFKKKPQVTHRYIPRKQYMQLLRHQQQMQQGGQY